MHVLHVVSYWAASFQQSEGYARNLTVLMKLNAKNVIFEALSRCWCYYSKKGSSFYLKMTATHTNSQTVQC